MPALPARPVPGEAILTGGLYRPVPSFYRRAQRVMTAAMVVWFVVFAVVFGLSPDQAGPGDVFVAVLGLLVYAVITAWLRHKAAGGL